MVLNIFFNISFCDVAERWQLGIQDPATPTMEGMLNFHNYIMIFLISIGCIILWMLFKVVINFNEKDHPIPQKFTHSSILEIIWTILPAFLLFNLAVPSFSLLYAMDELPTPQGTLKCVGHQWYWTYEYSDIFVIKDPSYGICKQQFIRTPTNKNLSPLLSSESDDLSDLSSLVHFKDIDENAALIKQRWTWDSLGSMESGATLELTNYSGIEFQNIETESYLITDSVEDEFYRLLSVDNSAKIPAKRHIRILITSADVLHSWAVPSLGIKVDACPGRLNQTSLFIKHYGQCSEICGVNHGFMPIVVESFEIDSKDYLDIPSNTNFTTLAIMLNTNTT
jgi:heme/copper-type cytochrome/quinol oxidase subunit 2